MYPSTKTYVTANSASSLTALIDRSWRAMAKAARHLGAGAVPKFPCRSLLES